MIRLWLVGKVNSENYKEWEFQGVFITKARAVAACKDEFYFVGVLTLNEALPYESEDWPGAYYPMRGD